MEIEDFLPIYPNIDPFKKNFLNPYPDESFNEAIFKKKEFYENRLEQFEDKPEEVGELLDHQKIIANYLSSNTLFNTLLLFHEMGTGKTCSAVSLIEKIRKENTTIDGAVVIVKGPAQIENFINELVFVCTGGNYVPENYNSLTKETKRTRINRLVRQFYTFKRFETFSKEIIGLEDFEIKNEYSNKIIVIDEAHNIRENTDNYKIMSRFLHTINNNKILLLTGTPMKDLSIEIAALMNLLLPLDNQLPMGDSFKKEYLTEDNRVKEDKKMELKSYFHGRVSFLQALPSDVKVVYEGQQIEDENHSIKLFNIFIDVMEEFQTKYYLEAFKKDTSMVEKQIPGKIKKIRESGIYSNASQASLLVYPNGLYGEKGFKDYIESKEERTLESDVRKFSYKLKPKFRQESKMVIGDNEKNLENLRKFSSKYATVIETILNAGDKLCFIYGDLVKGSGIILFSKILELFGFSQALPNRNKTKKLRYALLTSDVATTNEMVQLKNDFNRKENMNGDHIKVLIGSGVISEGFSFKNVQQIHILTPYWNYTETIQAIYRGLRAFSHQDLLNAGQDVTVKIYQHASIPHNKDSKEAIDIKKYSYSERKDIAIKEIERLLKEAAFDCALNYYRNREDSSKDGSRGCEYMECAYSCDNISMSLVENGCQPPCELDYSTYQLYYAQTRIYRLKEQIITMFRSNFVLDLDSIKRQIKMEYTQFELLTALKELIDLSVLITDSYGFKSILREENDIYFLCNNFLENVEFLSQYYTQNLSIHLKQSFDNLLLNYVPPLVCLLKEKSDNDTRKNILSVLPDFIKEFLLEKLIEDEFRRRDAPHPTDDDKDFRDWFLTHYSKEWKKITADGQTIIISYLLGSKNTRCLYLGEQWKDCSKEETSKFEDLQKGDIESKLQDFAQRSKDFGNFFGILTSKEGQTQFKIIDSSRIGAEDKREQFSGRVCKYWHKDELAKIALKSHLGIPKDFKNLPKTDIINLLLKQKFAYILYDIENFNKKEGITDKNKKDLEKELKKLGLDDLRRILYALTTKIATQEDLAATEKGTSCYQIREWFEKNNLLLDLR